MGSCIIKRTEYGTVSEVKTRDGNKSILFGKIAGIPFIRSEEKAIDLYMNLFTDKFKNKFGDWESKIAKNKKAVSSIRYKTMDLGNADNIVAMAKTMVNPVLVRKLDDKIGDRDLYTTDLGEPGGEYYLYDENMSDVIDMEASSVPDDSDARTVERDSIANNPNSIIDMTLISGEKVKAILPSHEVINAKDISVEDTVSPFTYENGEPKLFFLSGDGKVFDTYEDALRNTGTGFIQVGFLSGNVERVTSDQASVSSSADISVNGDKITLHNPDSFMRIMQIDSNSNPLTYDGLINSLIKKGYISGTMEKFGDEYYLVGQGSEPKAATYNANIAMGYIRLMPGYGRSFIDDEGRMRIVKKEDSRVLMSSDDLGLESFSKEEIKTMLKEGRYKELKANYPDIDILAAVLFQEDNDLFHSNKTEIIENAKNRDRDLRRAMMQVISRLGVSVIGMSEYLEKYKDRFGVEPSAVALADLGNKLIALGDRSGVDDLTEEVSHFLVETYNDQIEIERLLPEVENTEEWQQYSKQYFNIYGKKYSGDQLQTVVRKEILGKVLRNEFIRRFYSYTEGEQSFVSRLLDLFRNMVTRIQSMFDSSVKEDFDNLVKQMADDVLADDPNAFDIRNIESSDFVLYSANQEETMRFFNDAKMRLQAQLNIAQRSKSAMTQQLRGDVSRLNRAIGDISDSINDLNVRESVSNIVTAAEAQTNFLTRLVGAYKSELDRGNDDAKFDLSDQQNLDNINTLMLPMIKELRGHINNEDLGLDTEFKNRIFNRIDDTVSKIEALNADVNVLRRSDSNAIAERLNETFGVDEEGKEHCKNFLNNVMKDVSWISRWFGTLEHSSNPLLKMLMRLISGNNYSANIKTQDDMLNTIRSAQEEGWDIKKFEGLLQKDGDNYSSYLMSEYDYVKFRKEYQRAQVEALKAAKPDIKEDVDDIIKTGYIKIGDEIFAPNIHGVHLNFLNADEREAYDKSMSDWISKNCQRRYKDEYYTEIENIYKDAENREDGTVRPISAKARRFVREIASRRYQVKRRFMENGKVNWTKLNADVYASQEWKELSWSNRSASSLIDPVTGERKTGDDLILAEDLRAINKAWERWGNKNGSNKGVKRDFMVELRRIQKEEGPAQAFDFLIANSNLQFSDKFWNNLGEGRNGAIERILDKTSDSYAKDFEDEPIPMNRMADLRTAFNNLKRLQDEQKEILKMYRGTALPGEINYDLMSQGVKDRIKEIQLEIQYSNRDIYKITKNPSFEGGIETEYTINEAFNMALRDSVGDDVLSFCRKHSTAQNQVSMDTFKKKIDEIKRNKAVRFSIMERRLLASHGFQSNDLVKELIEANKSNPEILDRLVDDYAKSLVLPYFKRFSPKGYSEWLANARSMDVATFAQSVLDGNGKSIASYMTIQPAREWQEEGSYFDKYLNENYKENSDYGYYQPNNSYKNDEYFKRFGISSSGGLATKNVEEWNMIKRLVDLKRKALGADGYNEGERSGYNLYEIPQVSKSSIERIFQLGKEPKAMAMNSIRDLVGVRVDDPIYGQTSDLKVDGVDMEQFRAIPKYYLRELEEPSDLSHDLVRSYTLFMLQSNLYNEKMSTIGDVMGLQQMLLNAKFEKGITPKASNSYNMFKDWMDAHFYGVKSNSKKIEYEVAGMKIDVSKLANAFDKFVRYQNLAFSIPVATTAAITGQLNAAVEGAVGQYVNTKSLHFADKEILKMTSGYISEVGMIDRKNKLYVLGERMGIYSILDRTKSAGYNRTIRILGDNLGYKMMDVLNYPLAPKMMISVMDDTRMDENGKFYRFNSFSRKMKRDAYSRGETLSNKEINQAWDKLKNRSLYNILEIKDGVVAVKDGFDKNVVEKQMKVTQREIRSLNNICDGTLSQEDKSAATRNWMLNFTMAHRGWFQIAFQRRWKKAGYNYSTNQMEEGSNRTVMRYIADTFKILKEDRTKKLFSVLNDNWNKMSYWEKTNMYRTMIDMVVFLGGTLVFMAAMGYWDDDEDDNPYSGRLYGNEGNSSWLMALTSYTLIRSVNEMYSQLPMLLEINAVDTMYNPFPVMAKLRDLVMPKNWSFDEVKSGSYEGETKLWRLFAKQTWLKQWYSMKSAEDIDRTMKGWLLNNPIMFLKKPKDNEEEILKEDGRFY